MFNYNTSFLEKPITFTAVPHGRDYAISIMGGDKPHIGAIAVCIPGSLASVTLVPGHREDALALSLADSISHSLDCVVSVSAGIHYDTISKSQLDEIIQIVNDLTATFVGDVNVL